MNLEKVLDNLIAVNVDSQRRYHHAELDVGKEYLAKFFDETATARQRFADELQAQRTALGGKEKESGTIGGTLDTAAMDFNVTMSMGDTGVVDWCRKDAESGAEEYQKALAEDLPPNIRSIVERQLHAIRGTIGSLEEVLRRYGGPRS